MSRRSSSAKIFIMASRCSNEAGLGALSAFWVARRRSSRLGFSLGLSFNRAEVQIRRSKAISQSSSLHICKNLALMPRLRFQSNEFKNSSMEKELLTSPRRRIERRIQYV